MTRYDAVVIGAGPGGSAAAQQVVLRGGRACMIEAGRIGGTCVNVGCMPTKALLAASHRAWAIRTADGFGLSNASFHVDGKKIMKRVSRLADKLQAATREKVESIDGLDLVRGRARKVAPGAVVVETDNTTETIEADSVVLATGSEPIQPEMLPWESPHVVTSDRAIRADDLPRRVVVMGGGPLGCEFATAWAELGSEVVLAEMQDRLLGRFDPDVSDQACRSLRDRGAQLRLSAKVTDVQDRGDELCVSFDEGDDVHCDMLLAATGRRPRIENLGLEELGLEIKDGHVCVDARCTTNVENVYAVGDVAEQRKHAHLAVRMGTVAGDNIMGVASRDDRTVVPVVVYTHPEIASVGSCGELQCADRDEVTTLHRDMADSGSGMVLGLAEGLLKVHVRSGSGEICGCLWSGERASDMIHEAALAIRHGLTMTDLFWTIHAHPGLQESLHALAEEWVEDKITQGR